MEAISEFRKRVHGALSQIDPTILAYNKEEFWMIRSPYEYLEYLAEKNRWYNTSLALPLARGLHDGSHRKNPIVRNGEKFRPPYMIHCLTVCKMLADLWLPLSSDEKDILLAAALCHDMIEDVDFPDHGLELTEKFGLDPRVYETVRLVSKRYDFTPEEEKAFFHGIESHPLALLIKLSDRGHNVTDLYNMSDAKIREYIGETRTFFLPMCDYGFRHYPDLQGVLEILQDQLITLTKTVEMLSERHRRTSRELTERLRALREENELLRYRSQILKERSLDHD